MGGWFIGHSAAKNHPYFHQWESKVPYKYAAHPFYIGYNLKMSHDNGTKLSVPTLSDINLMTSLKIFWNFIIFCFICYAISSFSWCHVMQFCDHLLNHSWLTLPCQCFHSALSTLRMLLMHWPRWWLSMTVLRGVELSTAATQSSKTQIFHSIVSQRITHVWTMTKEQKIRKFRTDKFDTCNKRKFWLMQLM